MSLVLWQLWTWAVWVVLLCSWELGFGTGWVSRVATGSSQDLGTASGRDWWLLRPLTAGLAEAAWLGSSSMGFC
jgi:hypothetical protein